MRPIHGWPLLVPLALGGCSGASPVGGDVPPNLVLVTLDTTRADRLGCYGYERATTPVLDALAEQGALVERAIAVAPLTLPSHASILTGLYPPRHGVRDNSDFRLPPSAVTLAEHLAARGYATAAAVGAYVLSADFGIGQGFERFDEPRDARAPTPGGRDLRHAEMLERPAAAVTERALALLEESLAEPFFLWIHYFDPHRDYAPPEPHAARHTGRPYDGEIAYTDEQLGRVVGRLAGDGRLERTLLVVTADHGESLGQHGEETHGLFVYDATQRVPLLVRLPGMVPAGLRVEVPVSGVDVAPTVLDLLGVDPLDGIDGVSRAAALRGAAAGPGPPIYAEAQLPHRAYGWSPLFALELDRVKYVEAPRPELYDLRNDPGERRNLAAADPRRLEPWARRLQELRAGWTAADPRARRGLDPAERERLVALGYLSGGGPAGSRAGGPDPKDRVALHNRLLDAQSRIAEGRLAEASRTLDDVLRADPINPAALGLAGALDCAAGRCEVGLRRLEEAARRAPGVYQIQRNLANALHLDGRLQDAARAYRAAIALHPFSGEDRYGLANVLVELGELEPAIATYREALRLGPRSAPLLAALGVALARGGDAAAARQALLEAVEAAPDLAEGWSELGLLAERAGDLDAADRHYATALDNAPADRVALFGRAKVLLLQGRNAAARDAARRMLRHHPDDDAGLYLAARAEWAGGDRREARRALERLLTLPEADPRWVEAARELEAQLGD